MTQWIVGELELITAFEHNNTLYVVGTGMAPSSCWESDFLPDLSPEKPAQLTFCQRKTCDIDIQVQTPFSCVEIVPDHEYGKSIRILFRKTGAGPGAAVESINIRSTLTASDMYVVLHNNPVQVFLADAPELNIAPEATLEVFKKTAYKRVIASFTNPLDCFDPSPPRFKGMRHEWTLQVTTASDRDIKGAVEDCLRKAAIAAALAALSPLLIPGGPPLQAAIAAFLAVLKPCLAAKLPDLVSVDVTHRQRCN